MCLVEVLELHGKLGEIDFCALLQPLDRFVQAIAVDYPLRPHAYVGTEQLLQRTLANVPLRHDLLHRDYFAILSDLIDDVADPFNVRIGWSLPLVQEPLDCRGLLGIAAEIRHLASERESLWA